jgi:hypothetical protein
MILLGVQLTRAQLDKVRRHLYHDTLHSYICMELDTLDFTHDSALHQLLSAEADKHLHHVSQLEHEFPLLVDRPISEGPCILAPIRRVLSGNIQRQAGQALAILFHM